MSIKFLPLDASDMLVVTGPDWRKFLQGQVTCNVDDLSKQRPLVGAICNIKGRVVADFRLVLLENDCCMQLEQGIGVKVKTILDKYIIFSKAKTELAGGRIARFGFFGTNSDAILAQHFQRIPAQVGSAEINGSFTLIRIPGTTPRFEIWLDRQSAPESCFRLIEQVASDFGSATSSDWKIEDIECGISHVNIRTSELHLPQQLNYDLTGVINFNKGCYTGQEIIARMHYRSTAKQRLAILNVSNCTGLISIAVTDEQGQVHTIEILDQSQDAAGNLHLLAIIPLAPWVEDKSFQVIGCPQASVYVRPLPYLEGNMN